VQKRASTARILGRKAAKWPPFSFIQRQMRSKKSEVSELPKAEFQRLSLPIRPPYPPMEARQAKEIPEGKQYIYEPKWDGFRCLAFRDGEKIVLQSKAGQPLGRYFPEIVAALARVKAKKFVLDSEIVVEVGGHLDFDAILQRIHPAESRIKRLSAETPARMLCFDLLVDPEGESLVDNPLSERKKSLQAFFKKQVGKNATVELSPFSEELKQAERWMHDLAAYGCDGVMAKLADEPYHSGDRDGMVKIKRMRTAECVVGGFRYATRKGNGVGSLLLGLHNDAGQLDHIGFCSSFSAAEKLKLVKTLKPLVGGEGFTGKTPGGPSRWNAFNDRSGEFEPLTPKLVCEVQYDHISNGRFRHGTKFLRWRPDKSPKQCTFEHLEPAKKPPKPRRSQEEEPLAS
jgi:ATP-dependent DNA ligase